MTKYIQWTENIKVTESDYDELMNNLKYFGTCYVIDEDGIGKRIAPENIFIGQEKK